VKISKLFVFVIIASAVLFYFQNCGLVDHEGTETGNLTTTPASVAGAPTGNAILQAACEKISVCDSTVSLTTCENDLLASNSIDTALGLPAGYGTLQQILDAESVGQLAVNATAANACISDIQMLSCTAVTASAPTPTPTNTSSLSGIIPANPSCSSVYSAPSN